VFSLFSKVAQKIEVDGELLPLASVLKRGTAVAVDLCLAVGVGSILFYLVSLVEPLDTGAAKVPIFMIMTLVVGYVAVGRNMMPSPGRKLLRLRLTRLPGPAPGLHGRQVTVHMDPNPTEDGSQTTRACVAVGLATVLSILCLSAALQTTLVYQTVVAYNATARPLANAAGQAAILSTIPRALLISPTRAYVQVSADIGEQRTVIEFFLHREKGVPWQVRLARETAPHSFGTYSLGTIEAEVPKP